MANKAPTYIKVNGHMYKLASVDKRAAADPETTSALTALSLAHKKYNSADTPEKVADARGDLYEAAKQLAQATR